MRRCIELSLLVVLLAGCGGGSDQPKADDGEPPDPNANVIPWAEGTKTTGGVAVIKLEGVSEVVLADLLNLPRADLAAQTEDCAVRIQYLEQLHLEGRLPFLLLPGATFPSTVPVLRQAKYSAQRGFSVPPYLPEDRKDSELALHLARYGDVEAARKLVNPADIEATRQLKGMELERNYPVEWTRLVGLLLRHAQYHVLTGNVDEVKRLIGIHQQLNKLLGPKARSSPLGVELLARGRAILRQAAGAWRANKQDDLAAQAETIAAAWGDIAPLALPWQPSLPRTRAEQVFDAKSTSKALSAPAPLRVLDLLGLPVPDYGLENVVGTFDAADRLVETLLLYRTREDEYYPRPEALTQVVMECLNQPARTPPNEAPTGGIPWQTIQIGSAAVDVGIVLHNPAVSAMIRVRAAKREARPEHLGVFLPRDFGAVDLDRSFEQMRRRVALHQRANLIKVSARAALDLVHNPITALPPSSMTLERAPSHDVLSRITLSFDPREKGRVPLGTLASPLWALGGQAQISGGQGSRPLLLAWEDDQTCYVLRLPNRKDEKVTLDVYARSKEEHTDLPGSEWVDRVETDVAARAALVLARDRDERRARITEGTPWTRLPRDLEKIRLGMSRAEVQQVLPPEFKAYQRPIPNGILVTVIGPTPRGPVATAREFCALFDAAGRIAEVRARYQSGSGPAGLVKLVADLEKRCGAPDNAPGPWVQTWADLPKRKPAPVLRRWQDDTTLLTCQQDGYGIELRLRDAPLDHEDGVPVPPLAYLPRGPADCVLGTTKDALFRQWKVGTPVLAADGAVVLAPKATSPLDALLVWFKNDRVVHVIGRHKTKGSLDPAQAGGAVTAAWGQEGRSLGLPWRQDFSEDGALQSWTTQDDQTRVRIFWQQRNSDGVRLVFTEWRDLTN